MNGPKKESYVECPACTKEAGESVVYHKSALRQKDADLFDDTALVQCPKGHTIREGVL